MKTIKAMAGWASDGTVSVWMKNEMFAGMGDTVEEAIKDLNEGAKLFVQWAKEDGESYPPFLDEPYELELEYDAVSMLQYARGYIKDTKLAELTGISAAQLGRYANDKAKPRAPQRRKIIEGLRKFATPLASIAM